MYTLYLNWPRLRFCLWQVGKTRRASHLQLQPAFDCMHGAAPLQRAYIFLYHMAAIPEAMPQQRWLLRHAGGVLHGNTESLPVLVGQIVMDMPMSENVEMRQTCRCACATLPT